MKCEHCGHQYPANYYSLFPGGTSSPGAFFYFNLVWLASCLVLGLLVSSYCYWGLLLVPFLAMITFDAMLDCRGTHSEVRPGSVCPECDELNRIYPWSL